MFFEKKFENNFPPKNFLKKFFPKFFLKKNFKKLIFVPIFFSQNKFFSKQIFFKNSYEKFCIKKCSTQFYFLNNFSYRTLTRRRLPRLFDGQYASNYYNYIEMSFIH